MDQEEDIPRCDVCGEEMRPVVVSDGPGETRLTDGGQLETTVPVGWQCGNSECSTNQPGSLGGDNGGG